MLRFTIFCLLIIMCTEDVSCKTLRREKSSLQSDENASGERTLMISNLVLLPIMAGVGVKFLILLPIILSKIALLGILSFVSSNLSLLISAIMGVRSYFFEDNPTEEDYDHDGNYKSRYESDDLHKYASHKDPHDVYHHHEDNYDPHDKYTHRYKGYEHSHPGYNSYHPQYRYRDDHKYSKKRFRPFKLLERIKDAIKDHFHKSRGHGKKYHEYDNDYKHHSPDFDDNHNEYNHEMHDTRYRIPDYMITSHQSGSKGKFYEGYKVPLDSAYKDEPRSNHPLKSEKNEDRVIGNSNGLLDSQLQIPVKDNGGELLMNSNPNFTQLQTTGYKVYENEPTFKEPFIVLGVRAEAPESDSQDAFYGTDYKITDFHTVPQADTSK